MRDVETDRLPLSKLARVLRRASTLSTGRSLPLNRRKARASPRRLDQSQAPAPPVPLRRGTFVVFPGAVSPLTAFIFCVEVAHAVPGLRARLDSDSFM